MPLPVMSSSPEWIERQEEMMSDVLVEAMIDGGPDRVRQVLSAAIMSWIDYHQKEVSKWENLASSLQMEQWPQCRP